jgi:hypothetical protein
MGLLTRDALYMASHAEDVVFPSYKVTARDHALFAGRACETMLMPSMSINEDCAAWNKKLAGKTDETTGAAGGSSVQPEEGVDVLFDKPLASDAT